MSIETLSIGDTGAQLVSKFNQNFSRVDPAPFFNVKGFGAIGDGVTDDSVAINNAVTVAELHGGTIYFPAGTYLTGTIDLNANINIVGDGLTSILKSIAAEPLLRYLDDEINRPWIHDIYLDGGGVGTSGIYLNRCNAFYLNNITIANFTVAGIYAKGVLICAFYNIIITTCPIGFYCYASTTPFSLAANLIKLYNCHFRYCSSWAIEWNSGQLLCLDLCGAELCGTEGNSETGVIKYLAGNSITNLRSIGLSLKDCWFEYNYGTIIDIRSWLENRAVHSVIDTCLFTLNTESVVVNLYSHYNKGCSLKVRDSSFSDAAAFTLTGTETVLINDSSQIYGSITQNGDAKYYTVDITEVT